MRFYRRVRGYDGDDLHTFKGIGRFGASVSIPGRIRKLLIINESEFYVARSGNITISGNFLQKKKNPL